MRPVNWVLDVGYDAAEYKDEAAATVLKLVGRVLDVGYHAG